MGRRDGGKTKCEKCGIYVTNYAGHIRRKRCSVQHVRHKEN